MTIAAVGGQNTGATGSGTSVSVAFPSNVAVGSLISVVGWRYEPSADAYIAGDCTKSAGTATIGTVTLDAQLDQVDGGGGRATVGIWSAIVTGAGSLTMQVAGGSAGGFPCIAINEFSGNWDSTRVESTNTNGTSATNTTPAHSNNATSAGAALFIGGLSLGNSGGSMTITPDAAFTQTYENEAGGTSQAGSSIYRIVTGGTTDRAEWTVPTSGNNGWGCAVVAYKEGGPTITSQPDNSTVYEGQTANFSITATGTGTLHYQWKDDASNVGTDSSTYAPTPVLSDSGSIITCVVTDDIGSTTSNNALLTVLAVGKTAWIRA